MDIFVSTLLSTTREVLVEEGQYSDVYNQL
jgi:hypothetical protein